LYGTHGRTNWSLIGKPGTPEEKRMRFDGGVYRYHPVRHVWEPFADGTTNPWGIDWDDYGQGFVCNCVDPHLFHVIQGAHYEPWRNRESSRYAYQRIATIADHLHFVGKGSVVDGIGTPAEDLAGGGHAHCGTMIYLGDQWPERYRNTVFMHNLHGHRINNDILRRAGSGYIASHGPDFLRARDTWYMGVTLQYGPDGEVYSSDWSDTGECHSVVNTQRGTGRIYKITYGESRGVKVDLQALSNRELVDLQLHRNDWYVRHARRILQERAALGRDLSSAARQLHELLARPQQPVDRKLRVIWALHTIGRADDDFLMARLNDESEYVRAWAIRLLTEDHEPPRAALALFGDLAATDPSPFVCLHLASALQRLGAEQRWAIAEALTSREEFSADANIPLMVWYGVEPLIDNDLSRFVKLAVRAEMPLVSRLIARRVAAHSKLRDNGMDLLIEALAESDSAEQVRELLGGILTGLEGTRSVAMPKRWPTISAKLRESADAAVRDRALRLSLIFDDPVAIRSLLEQATDPKSAAEVRQRAIEALAAQRVSGFDSHLLALLRETPVVRRAAVRSLAAYDHPDTAASILAIYSQADPATRQDALATLSARRSWAGTLLDAVDENRIPRGDLTAFIARQIHSLRDKSLSTRIEKLWGQIRETPREKARQIANYKQQLTSQELIAGDRARGRLHFEKLCANCHQLFGDGTAIGPDLTGAQRTNIDYLLLNLVDPSSSISRDFQMQVIETTEGRVVTGLVVAQSDHAITVQTANERIVIPFAEIERQTESGVSMMPEGLLQPLAPDELRNLFAYLTGEGQAPRALGNGQPVKPAAPERGR
jgi:putative heme-binding domain-containing protein